MTVAVRSTRQKQTPRPEAAALLVWYDRHRRVLPWRALPGRRTDAYCVWLSEVMLQQTTVTAVAPYYARFLERWPNVEALAAAPLDDVLKAWAGLGYYARARNLHACAKAVMERHNGQFPASEDELRALPGIGAYTAAAIAAIVFDQPASPVDGNIERVVARLFAVEEEFPAAKPTIRALAASLTPKQRAGDFAQAMMDLGATICTPKKPACVLCAWCDGCAARRRGDPETFPIKPAKKSGKLRRGAAFVVQRKDGAVLVRARPEKGLLGGMTEVPTTEWAHDFVRDNALSNAPVKAEWKRVPGTVSHVFTHFPLELEVYRAEVPIRTKAPAGMRFVAADELQGEALPTVMRKVVAHALPHVMVPKRTVRGG